MSPRIGPPNATTGVVVGSLDGAGGSGDGASYVVTEHPDHGVVSVWPTGGFIYTPDPRARLAVYSSGVATTDGFTVTATDAGGRSNAISVADVPVHSTRAAVVATVPVSEEPEAVTLSPDDTLAYVIHSAGDRASVIDTTTHSVVGIVPIADVPSPSTRAIDGTVEVIRPAIHIEPANLPRSVAVNTTGTCAFVANPADATVSVVKIAEPS